MWNINEKNRCVHFTLKIDYIREVRVEVLVLLINNFSSDVCINLFCIETCRKKNNLIEMKCEPKRTKSRVLVHYTYMEQTHTSYKYTVSIRAKWHWIVFVINFHLTLSTFCAFWHKHKQTTTHHDTFGRTVTNLTYSLFVGEIHPSTHSILDGHRWVFFESIHTHTVANPHPSDFVVCR